MTLDEAREALEEVFGINGELVSSQDNRDLIIEVGDTKVSYEMLADLARKLGTNKINFENSTCEQGYYGEHSDGHTTLRISGVLDEQPKAAQGPGPSTLSCSFCGKGQREVKKLIAGPTVYICNECVGLCQKILEEP